MFEPGPIPFLNDKKKMDSYCVHLLNLLADETSARQSFSQCASLLKDVLRKADFQARESDRLRAFTTEITAATSMKSKATPAVVERKRGRVKFFSDIKGYGFIAADDGVDLFVHYTGIKGSGYRSLAEDQIVEFFVTDGRKGPIANQVEVVAHKAQPA